MQIIIVLGVLLATVTADFYSSKYDDFDINPLLENDRILLSYIKCFLEEGACTPDAKDFRKVIPEALETSCNKCTPKQKHLIKTVIKTVMERQPEAWKKLVKKYDNNQKFKENFDKFFAEAKK